jgi:hypothetical protein
MDIAGGEARAMTDQNAVRDDISFLRRLAEQGRDAPLNSGSSLFAAGMIFGVASAIAVWGGETGRITNGLAYPVIFFGAGLLHAAVMWRVRRSRDALDGAGSTTNRAANIAWTSVAAAIVAATLGLIAIGVTTHDWLVMRAMPPLVMAFYGAAWTVAAAMSRQRWLWTVALGAFAVTVALGFAAASALAFYGLFVAAVFLLVALPGLILMLQARGAA